MSPTATSARARRAALGAGRALLFAAVVLGGCGQPPATQRAAVCTPVDAGQCGLEASLTRRSLSPDDDPICGPWRVCD